MVLCLLTTVADKPHLCDLLLSRPAVAVLAFFALRPGKGWLRRRGAAGAAKDGTQRDLKSVELSPGDKEVFITPMPTGVLDSFLPPEARRSQAMALAATQPAGNDNTGGSSPGAAPNRWVVQRRGGGSVAARQQGHMMRQAAKPALGASSLAQRDNA